jgi:hypothetical protein
MTQKVGNESELNLSGSTTLIFPSFFPHFCHEGSLKHHLCRAYNMTPYLGEIGKLVDFPDTYQRKYLHETVRNQTARR